jgi:hypothetical protein
MLRDADAATLRRWGRKIRTLCPLDKPVRIRRVTGPDCGLCWDFPDHYLIHLNRDLCRQATWDTLIHEWCHLMRGEFENDPEGLHDDTFWILYGSIYRAWDREK